jgi:hypothetical protein
MNGTDDNGRLIKVAVTVVAVLVIGVGVWLLHKMLKAPERPHQVVQQFSLLKQPPPPPPKPPDKPPEPPKIKEEVKIPQDEPKPAEKPADQKPVEDKPLGVDATGAAGGDSFGLAARSGGNDLVSGGTGTGAYYTGLIQRQLHEVLMRNKQLQHQEFKVVIEVEFSADGRMVHSNVVSSSGNKDVDQQIIAALADTPPLKDAPPANLRDVEVRLSNHI